jgi:hypothetical protein
MVGGDGPPLAVVADGIPHRLRRAPVERQEAADEVVLPDHAAQAQRSARRDEGLVVAEREAVVRVLVELRAREHEVEVHGWTLARVVRGFWIRCVGDGRDRQRGEGREERGEVQAASRTQHGAESGSDAASVDWRSMPGD